VGPCHYLPQVCIYISISQMLLRVCCYKTEGAASTAIEASALICGSLTGMENQSWNTEIGVFQVGWSFFFS
jgi:hypothetical protein